MKKNVSLWNISRWYFLMTFLIITFAGRAQTCVGNKFTNGSLESGTFAASTKSGVTTQMTTFGGSQSVYLPFTASGVWDHPVDGFAANIGYWVDGTTNGGTGAKDQNRFFAIPSNFGANRCLWPTAGYGMVLTKGQCYRVCFWAAQFDPAQPNANVTSTFNFEMYDGWGSTTPAATVANFSVTPTSTTGDYVKFTLPASTNVKDLTGAAYTGASGQVVDWKTLNWQYICLDVTPLVESSRFELYISTDGVKDNGLAIDGLCAVACGTSSCTVPVASATPQKQTICVDGTATAFTATPSTGVEYKWYGPLTNTSGSLGTAISGATTATFTPSGAALSTVGSKYYAVVVNTTGDVTCADTAFVQLDVSKITVPAVTAVCHANGTPEDASDDYMTFSVNITNEPISLNKFTVTATQGGNPITITLSDGSPATALNCGLEAALRTPAGSAGNGNITLTITDNVTGCSTTLTIIDSGTCAVACVEGTPSTVSYEYATQVDVTDLDKLPIIIPKFDEQGGTRVLKSVKLEYTVGGKTSFALENRAAQQQSFTAIGTSEAYIELNGTEIAASTVTMPVPQTTLPGGILVPASGNWAGDVLQGSTLTTLGRMWSWVSDYLGLFKDPRTDPRWVTNATGNAVNDDDMLLVPMVEDTAKGSFTYTTVGDLAPFIGTGNVPLNVSTLSGLSLSGGGGNIYAIQRTRAYASAKVTYTYECVELCIKPIAVVSVKSQTICAGDNASAYTVAPSTGVDYKWYGPLADTTSSLGTAISGQTTASYTPTGTALTTAGTKYYAVIVNTTGDVTCADTAFVQLQVRNLGITAIASSCDPTTNKFSVSGQITFTTPPSTGVLRVRIPGKAYTDFLPPFSSPLSYTLSGLNSDGLADTVEVMFSDGTCKQIAVYNAPAMCLPNVCSGTDVAGETTYKFTIPLKRTNWSDTLSLPKFDDMGGTRTLKNVLLTVNQSIVNWGVAESTDNEDTEINIETTGTTTFKLDGNNFETNSFTATNYPKNVTRAVLVPATGTWPGDNTAGSSPSTLFAMSSTVNNDLNNLVDPTLSPTWVTNQTGDPTDDDDMTYFAPVYSDNTKCWLYSDALDLAKFTGTGNAELIARATASAFISGAGNVNSIIKTSASAEITVTYIYCETNCVKPVATTIPKVQTICVGSSPSAYVVSPSTGVEYKWYGPLADTTSSLGTAVSGATSASFTPSGAALTTAGTKYYAVVVNTTGDETCADTAYVQLVVNAKPVIADGSATICAGESVDLTSKITNYNSYQGQVWTVGTAGGTAVATPSSVKPTGTTTYVLVAQNAAGCKDTANVVVTVNAKPNAGKDTTLACVNAANNTLATSYTLVPSPTGGSWSQLGTTPTTAMITGNNVTGMSVTGTYQFIYTTTAGCKDTVAVTVAPCAGCVKPDAGPDAASVCQPTSTAKLTAVTVGGTWAPIGSPANPSAATIDASGNISGLNAAGTYRFVYSITGGGQICTDTAQVIVLAKPVIADGSTTICAGESVDLTTRITNYATYLSPVWTIGTAGGTAVTTPTSVKPTGTTTYVLVAQNGVGCKDTANVVVTVNAKPNAGKDTTLACVNAANNTLATSYTLVPSPTGGSWSQLGTTPTTATITANNVTGMSVTGTYQFIYTTTAGCKDTIAVTVAPCAGCVKPDAGADAAAVCQPTSTAKLTAVTPGGTWAPIGSSTNPSAATIDVSGNISGLSAAGTYRFVYSITGGGQICTDTAQVIVLAKPSAGKDTTLVCSNGNVPSSVQLSATPTGGTWSGLTGNPTGATVNSSGLVSITNPTAQGKSFDFVYLVNGCQDTVKVIVPVCQQPCIKSSISSAAPVCSNDAQTYSFTFTINNQLGIVKVSKGTLSGSNPYTVSGIPSGQNVIITDSLSAICKSDTIIAGVNCNCNPAMPQLLTPSLTVCIGDTFPTLKATVVGLATVEWFSQQTGGTVLATGLSFKPSGTVSANTTYYAQARSTDPTCPTAVSTSRVPATINAQTCIDTVDLALKKSINTKIAQVGDVLTYTLKVWNESNKNATGVEVADSIATTVQFIAGSFVASRGSATISGNAIKWTIGNIAANGDTVTLRYQVRATQEGLHFNTAEISKVDQKDVDSTPGNGNPAEDDIDRQCFSVPFKVCPTNQVEASVPALYTNVQWFKDGGTTPVATGNVVLFSEVGIYTFTATNQTCPAGGCCPIIIEPGVNCCPEDLCVPFTIQKRKKK